MTQYSRRDNNSLDARHHLRLGQENEPTMVPSASQLDHRDSLYQKRYAEPDDRVAKKTSTTTTTTTTTTIVRDESAAGQAIGETVGGGPDETRDRLQQQQVDLEPAIVEDLGSQAVSVDASNRSALLQAREFQQRNKHQQIIKDHASRTGVASLPQASASQPIDGHQLVTSIGTIAAKSSESQIVVAISKDGKEIQLKIQEMKPGIFEVGASRKECQKFLVEHQKIMSNLDKQRQAPLECWLGKYQKIQANEPNMSKEMRLVYMCMAENLQGCWKALLNQLELRLSLLDETCKFYESTEQLGGVLEQAELHVQTFRQEFLDGPAVAGTLRFNQALNELKRLNGIILIEWSKASRKQQSLVQLVGQIATGNLGDSRANQLVANGQALINYLQAYLQPLERRKIQLENVITTTSRTTANNLIERQTRIKFLKENSSLNKLKPANVGDGNNKCFDQEPWPRHQRLAQDENDTVGQNKRVATTTTSTTTNTSYIRGISSFNDLNLVDNWLNIKIEQLNSSLLSSLGIGIQDSRSILSKHEQIALECSSIEEATLNFNGKNIHALKQVDPRDDKVSQQQDTNAVGGAKNKRASLFELQKQLANKARDVITILDARIVLLRRTIDFYSRAKDATGDIGRMMRRLQVDNSLQSVQFVATELELKDVSSVVASGATILSELQQLQLAQRHGQRSSIVNLNLITNGIRTIIDQLNQDLAHLKTVLNQRRLVLLNEDGNKMAQNFSTKCKQLHQWLDTQAKAYLMANNRIELGPNQAPARAFYLGHEQLRLSIQSKTLEVEALLRLLSTLLESLDAKSELADDIQNDTDNLRQDWIQVTNCLDRRLELTKKYLLILQTSESIDHDLDSLDPKTTSTSMGQSARPRTPDERSEQDVQSAIDQALVQLANQVKNFVQDAKRLDTSLVLQPNGQMEANDEANRRPPLVDDLNKDQLIEQVNELYKRVSERRQIICNQDKPRGEKQQQQHHQPKQQQARPRDHQGVTSKNGRANASGGDQNDKPLRPPSKDCCPKFTKALPESQDVEPFSTVELDCELEPGLAECCQVDWLMNNNKRIPSSIKHSIGQVGQNKFKLTIRQFNPICCGTYTARAHHRLTGQMASTSCKLRLSGIKEHAEGDEEVQLVDQKVRPTVDSRKENVDGAKTDNDAVSSPALSSATLPVGPSSQWEPSNTGRGPATRTNIDSKTVDMSSRTESILTKTTTTTTTSTRAPGRSGENKKRALERIIQGVDSSSITTGEREAKEHSTGAINPAEPVAQLPVTQATYNGRSQLTSNAANQLRINYIDSPSSYSSSVNLNTTTATSDSRSVSKSPFEGSPLAPKFIQDLQEICGSSANGGRGSGNSHLVCVVVGNPPPTIEWLHNERPIATARCPKNEQSRAPKGKPASVCKLIIETVNNQTRGEYICRASNRLGKTTTNALDLKR